MNKNSNNKKDNKTLRIWLITAAIAIVSALFSCLIVYCFSNRKKNIVNPKIDDRSFNNSKILS